MKTNDLMYNILFFVSLITGAMSIILLGACTALAFIGAISVKEFLELLAWFLVFTAISRYAKYRGAE